MNKREAKAIAEIIIGSYLVYSDIFSGIDGVPDRDLNKVSAAAESLGFALLARNGLSAAIEENIDAFKLVHGRRQNANHALLAKGGANG